MIWLDVASVSVFPSPLVLRAHRHQDLPRLPAGLTGDRGQVPRSGLLLSSRTMVFTFKRSDAGAGGLSVVVDDGEGTGLVAECDEANNVATLPAPMCVGE